MRDRVPKTRCFICRAPLYENGGRPWATAPLSLDEGPGIRRHDFSIPICMNTRGACMLALEAWFGSLRQTPVPHRTLDQLLKA